MANFSRHIIFTCIIITFYGIFDLKPVSADRAGRKWRENWYKDMPIDHFSYPEVKSNKFNVKYLINDDWWDKNGGPIFFYAGNEGEISYFAEHVGLMWDWAPELKAMLVFAEHRYYGQSLPYKNNSFDQPNLAHLSADQAMADHMTIINKIKSDTPSAANSPVILFGGSYAGMLAAWMKVKYSDLITGAIASSAPIAQLNNEFAPCWAFTAAATRTFAESMPGCEEMVKKLPPTLRKFADDVDGRQWINDNFRLCVDDRINATNIGKFIVNVNKLWPNFALSNYPYPENFIYPLPAWPVKEACKFLLLPATDDKSFLLNVQKAIDMYFNYTGKLKCFSLTTANGVNEFESRAWSFQGCTELMINNACNREGDMFQKRDFNPSQKSYDCFEAFQIRPRWDWLSMTYGVKRIRQAKNIIFTNGHLDPWGDSGITKEMLQGADPSLVSIKILQGAHHYDLQGSHPDDTQEIIDVRNQMKEIVQKWIQDAKSQPEISPASFFTPMSNFQTQSPQSETTAYSEASPNPKEKGLSFWWRTLPPKSFE